jgi:hypothetical protein
MFGAQRNFLGGTNLMQGKTPLRLIALMIAALALALFAAGCGGDDQPEGSETNPGAPAGATGNEAGGAAVEAGKVRDPEEVQQEKETYGDEPPPVFLLSGATSGWNVNKPTAQIIRSKKELNAVKKKLKDATVDTGTLAPVDYNTRQVIAVQFPEEEGGTLMQVSSVNEIDGKVVIKTVLLPAGKGCPKGEAGNPFHVVETRAMKGDPTIEVETVKSSACK